MDRLQYNNKKANDKLVEERIKKGNTDKENLGYDFDKKVSEFINHYKNVHAAEKKLGKGFYVNASSMSRSNPVDVSKARNKEIGQEGKLLVIDLPFYFGKSRGNVVYSFSLNTPTGEKIVQIPAQHRYYPLNTYEIREIFVQIMDQDNRPINFERETFTLELYIKSF
ncbi:hypothetical protein PGB90_000835 [Kerria lacca]